MNGAPEEVEAKLTAGAPEARAILESLVTRDSIDGLSLGGARRVRIRDVYLDTPRLAISHWRGAMRIRVKDGATLLTVKGPAGDRNGPAIARPELEAPFSVETVERALAFMRSLMTDARDLPTTPVVTMDPPAIEGFEPFHDRSTLRVKREADVGSGRVEIAIDQATYDVHGESVTLAEIEVEAIEGGERAVVEATTAIRAAYPTLLPWPHSKLTVGLTLDRLAPEGWEGLVQGGVLTWAGLAALDEAAGD